MQNLACTLVNPYEFCKSSITIPEINRQIYCLNTSCTFEVFLKSSPTGSRPYKGNEWQMAVLHSMIDLQRERSSVERINISRSTTDIDTLRRLFPPFEEERSCAFAFSFVIQREVCLRVEI